MTVDAPIAFAIIVAVVPMPDAPPWISTDSPACSRPRWTRFSQTVRNVSGIAAASIMSRPGGSFIVVR